uniref:Zinc transporter 1-like n=1 Tax=Dermatophagoides pteronyssinus TaxID=6956 RepID=A0A6P6Y976_DERPT|nr:zinc transporter 1-like [Dermatophagoides pteronyssinus]
MMEIPPSITNLMNDDDSDDNILPKQQHSDVKIVKNSPATNVIEPQSSSVNVPNQFEQRPPPRLYLLYGIIILQTVIFISEIIIDQMVHSMLILADAYHHLFNSFNAILLVVCYKISNQITVKNTFGWVRTELLGMLTMITFIVALIFSLLIEGALQLLHLHEIAGPTNPKILIIFGVWSLIVNILYVLTINGVMTDKKYKQTTQKERSFSTAKCQRRRLSLSSLSSSTKKSETKTNKNTILIKTAKLTKTTISTTTTTTPTFPRNKIQEPDENIDLINNDDDDDNDNNHRTATMDPTSLMDEAYRIEFSASPLPQSSSSSSESDCFCRSFIQGILSPCFVIFCSFLITLAQHGNLQGYWEMTTVEMIDPLIGIITAISLCITFYPQLKNTFLILMQTVPEGVNIVQLKRELLDRFQMIENIHEFHIWLLNASDIVVTCHIVLPPQNTAEYSRLFDEIKQFLQQKYGIRYITIQPEFTTNNNNNNNYNYNHHYHNYQIERDQRRYSSNHCNNQCLVKCPCDSDGKCDQCLIKSCCNNNDITTTTTIDSIVVVDHHHHSNIRSET